MNVNLPSTTRQVRKTAEAVAWVLIVALLLDLLVSQARSDQPADPDEYPDHAVLTDLDLDVIEDGEQRRIRTSGGDTLRLDGEHVKEGNGDDE
ncbi:MULTISPECIES: hypothetical protein [Halomicrobium]|uniref:Uncharacterized protein n=2 Tax=Halomicrobium mukohataei TaxID=57705 RepID=C7P416_HALMD|nr:MULTISPECIES: hypothetical protein [Halomicrobium]ACV47838.1 conserved hypothetical protein [Halomicrobium mukohataei DSM 12286]QCD66282.1 hypothetical protein E5139_11740 [Halomicrobium mukohataei]QFR21088.1 hypothetical protein GBQ70_11735 [Halomicrobium sp. ZPS1]